MKHFKAISAIILLLGVVGTQGYPTSCEGVTEEQIVLLPNPGNCSTYIECVGEEPVALPCPVGLEWNDQTKMCDYPENANCQDTVNNSITRQYTNCEGVPSTVDILLPNPADCGSYIQCVNGQPMVRPCPPGLHWSVAASRCEWPEIANCRRNSCEGVSETEDVLLPNPEDCGTYIQCVHQEPVVRPCPVGLHWSVAENRCDWPNVANCNAASRTATTKRNSCDGAPDDEIILLPTPGNCSTFIECAYGREIVFACPQGLHWNVADERCDYPEHAQCEEQTKLSPKKNWTSCEGVPEEDIVLLPTPGNCSTYIECAFGEPVVMSCPGDLQWNAAEEQCDFPENAQCKEQAKLITRQNWTSCEGVPSAIDVLLPNPADCESYIQCVHGQPMVRPCPPGLHWSVTASRCDWPEIANCRRNSCNGVPETEDVLLPNPQDCGTFIQCVHQEPVVRPCPGGLHWNAAENRCDWPNVANCEVLNP